MSDIPVSFCLWMNLGTCCCWVWYIQLTTVSRPLTYPIMTIFNNKLNYLCSYVLLLASVLEQVIVGRNLEDKREWNLFFKVRELTLRVLSEVTAPCKVIWDFKSWCSRELRFFPASSTVVWINDSMLLYKDVLDSRSFCWNKESWSTLTLGLGSFPSSNNWRAETALAILPSFSEINLVERYRIRSPPQELLPPESSWTYRTGFSA